MRPVSNFTHFDTNWIQVTVSGLFAGKKGGALASSIHSYMQHGDPAIRSLVKHALTLVAQPIFTTVMRWLYDGELEDTYHEVGSSCQLVFSCNKARRDGQNDRASCFGNLNLAGSKRGPVKPMT